MTVHHEMTYTLEDVARVAAGEVAELAKDTKAMLDDRRRAIEQFVAETEAPSYGFNRGFGHNVDQAVPLDRCPELQENLIRSHSAGVGEFAPKEVVRAAMFIRAISLARGHSGVRPVVVETLLAMLNRDVTPCVPVFGSVGASGDLVPLSHIALTMLEGEGGLAFFGGDVLPAEDAMRAAGIPRIRLASKEGLALNNGVTFSTAYGVLSCLRVETLLKTAAVATAMSLQVLLGSDTPFRADLHALRPHPGAVKMAQWISRLIHGSPIVEAHRPYDIDGEVQDPYSLRCSAQVLGACHELVSAARTALQVEVNSVTDNPLLLPVPQGDPRKGAWVGQVVDIVSGGHFHGMPVAVHLYGLLQAMAIMASLSNTRCARFVDGRRNRGLNEDLKWRDEWQEDGVQRDAVSSGMMVPEYVSAALTNAILGAAMPSHLFSMPTDAGQEDHVSMCATLAARLWDTLPRLAELLAIELAFATQAAAIRRRADHIPSKVNLTQDELSRLSHLKDRLTEEARRLLNSRYERPLHDVLCEFTVRHPIAPEERLLSPACEAVRKEVEAIFPTVTRDRVLSFELRELATWVSGGGALRAAEEAMGAPL